MVAVVIGAAAQLVDENLKNNYTKLMPSFGQRTTSATTNTTTTTRKSSTTATSTHHPHWRSQNSIRKVLEVPPEMPVDGDVTGLRSEFLRTLFKINSRLVPIIAATNRLVSCIIVYN